MIILVRWGFNRAAVVAVRGAVRGASRVPAVLVGLVGVIVLAVTGRDIVVVSEIIMVSDTSFNNNHNNSNNSNSNRRIILINVLPVLLSPCFQNSLD